MTKGPRPLPDVLAEVRSRLLDDASLVRAVASGRRRGEEPPRWRRVEVRWVDLKAGRHLQTVSHDDTQAHTANAAGDGPDGPAAVVDDLLAQPFGHWHVETTDATHQVRVTKRGDAVVVTKARTEPVTVDRDHDRAKQRMLPESDPVFAALGLTGRDGTVKPSRRDKYRQVEDFLRVLDASLAEARRSGHLRRPTADDPLRIADLGCGNAYLTFAAQRFLTGERGLPVVVTGVDVKQQSRDHNEQVAAGLGLAAEFVVGSIREAELERPPDVVLALHACDTATDEALARAVRWQAPLVLAAPCCHHDVAAQLRKAATPAPFGELTRHGILRERLADTLTDALRALLVRQEGYRVDVMQFVESRHTPRNTLLRGVRTGAAPDDAVSREYDELVRTWSVRPALAALLGR